MYQTTIKGHGDNIIQHPITQEQLDNLKPCRMVNPMEGKHHGIKIPDDFDQIAATAEIKRVGQEVRAGKFPFWFMDKYYPFEGSFPRQIPECLAVMGLSFDDPMGLANVVHMDDPDSAPKAYLRWLTHPSHGQNVNVRDWTSKYVNFIETVPRSIKNIANGVYKYLVKAFEIKSYYGLARPEEVDPTILTAYPEGAPPHGEFITGHESAVCGGVGAVIKDFPAMSVDQRKDGLDVAYMWGMFRGLAEVHNGMSTVASMCIHPLFRKYLRKDVKKRYMMTRKEKQAADLLYKKR